jgi:hypothetical protein
VRHYPPIVYAPDEKSAMGFCETILVACSKCEWKAAFRRDELITAHGAACPMPSLLERLAAPGCAKIGQQWDRCGVHYVEPIEGPAS